MTPTTRDATDLLLRGSLALAKAARSGIRVDEQAMQANTVACLARIEEAKERMYADEVWSAWKRRFGDKASLTKNDQLATVLYDDFGHECRVWTEKKRRGTSSIALDHIDIPFLKEFSLFKALVNLSKRFDQLSREVIGGFLHPDFNLHTTTTFRSSSGKDHESEVEKGGFNFQNIPNRNPVQSVPLRSCFYPRPGWRIGELDFGAHEFKVAASIWADPGMVEYASDPKKDVHYDWTARCYSCTREQVSGSMRTHGKNKFVFPILYGSYYVSCARDLWEAVHKFSLALKDGTSLKDHLASKRIHSKEGLEAHIKGVEEDFYASFPTFAERKDKLWEEYQRTGRFATATGFVQWGCFSRNFVQNCVVQGPAFHCLLWSLVKVQEWLEKWRMKSLILGQIHDCILFDLAPGEEQDVLNAALYYMTVGIRKHWSWIVVPLQAELDVTEVDAPWSEKKPWVLADGEWIPKPKEKT